MKNNRKNQNDDGKYAKTPNLPLRFRNRHVFSFRCANISHGRTSFFEMIALRYVLFFLTEMKSFAKER